VFKSIATEHRVKWEIVTDISDYRIAAFFSVMQ